MFPPRIQWHGVTPLIERSQVTTRLCCVLGWPDGRRRGGYVDSDNGIHPRRLSNHRLLGKRNPIHQVISVTPQAARLPEEELTIPMACFFSGSNPTALAGYLVHNLCPR